MQADERPSWDAEQIKVIGYVLADWGKAIGQFAAIEMMRMNEDRTDLRNPMRDEAIRYVDSESQRLARVLTGLPAWSDDDPDAPPSDNVIR